MGNPGLKYTGTALPLLNTTYTLFSTVVAAATAANFFGLCSAKRFIMDIKNSHTGTLKWYKSDDRGTAWNQIGQVSVAVPAATASNVYDILVHGYRDWKIDFVNDGDTQTTFEIDMSLSDEIAKAS